MPESYKIEELQKEAIKRNGICLTKKYLGVFGKHKWKCNVCDHIWKASWSGINNNGSWCPKCSQKQAGLKTRKYKIEDLKKHAKIKNGKLISKEYIHTKLKVEWYCNFHKYNWKATWEKVRFGRWCPKCGRDKTREASLYTIEELSKIAEKYKGKLLSKKYLGVEKPHKFRCSNNHIFWKKPLSLTKSNPLSNSWCTFCKSRNHAEDFCRAVIETAFKKKFENGYFFDWLINSNGKKMQLDGYNNSLKLAFEYQGIQHTKIFKIWNINESTLKKRKKDDQTKVTLCKKMGIKLIQISDFGKYSNKSTDDLIRNIKASFKKSKVSLPEIKSKDVLRKFNFYKISNIKDLAKKALKKGLILKSKSYMGMNSRANWECKKCKYKWITSFNSIFYSSTGCPKCAGNLKLNIEAMKQLAISKGGECLSTTYKNTKSKLKWKCGNCKHQWEAGYDNIHPRVVKGKKLKGSWCPQCAKNKITGRPKNN